ncbi:MAG TPA: hypothetical protein VGI39_39115 [Polyangiaceae bacterium]|jgi:hypothetical protein
MIGETSGTTNASIYDPYVIRIDFGYVTGESLQNRMHSLRDRMLGLVEEMRASCWYGERMFPGLSRCSGTSHRYPLGDFDLRTALRVEPRTMRDAPRTPPWSRRQSGERERRPRRRRLRTWERDAPD